MKGLTLGEKIKKKRKELKLTQKSLAKLIKVTESTISMIESDQRKPSYEVLQELSKALDTSISELLDEQVDDNSDKFYFDRDNLSDEDIEYIKTTIEVLKKRAAERNK